MAALSEIEKLEARYAENPDGRYFAPLADAYRKAGRVDDALQMVQMGLSKHPDYLSAHIVLGRCLLDKKDDGAAQNAFQNVLGLDAENIIALKSLAEIAERQGRLVDARRWLQRLLTVDAMNDDAAADLERLGGPLGEGEAAAEAAPASAEPAAGFSMVDLLGPETPEEPAPAPEPVVAEAAPAALPPPAPPAPEPPAPRPWFTESPTAPIPAFGFVPTAEPPAAPPEPSEPLPFTFEPTASPEVEKTPVPPLHEFQSMSFERPAELPPLAPELETTSFEPPESVPSAPVEGFTDFDDQLAWGVGERMSHAIRAEDIEAAEHAASESAAPIEFVAPAGAEEPLPSLDLSGMEVAEERIELPARSTGAVEVDIGALDETPPATPTPSAPAPEAEAPQAAHDLPLIMPEDVTPPEELRRPSAKQVATVSPEPGGEAAAGSREEPLATETMGDLYLRQGLRSEAADVYRKILERHPGDTVVQGKLAAIESPPALGALAMGVESVGAWLRRIAKATLGAPAPAPAPPPPDELTPMDQAFEAPGEPEPPPAPAPVVEEAVGDGEAIKGAPARQASEALSLEQIFGTPAPAPAPPPPNGPHALGASFDEFFGAGAPAKESVRPKDAPAPRQSEDDLSAFTAWLHGLKR